MHMPSSSSANAEGLRFFYSNTTVYSLSIIMSGFKISTDPSTKVATSYGARKTPAGYLNILRVHTYERQI